MTGKKGEHDFFELYNFASLQRMKWHNPKWRFFVILLALALCWLAWQHLTTEYSFYAGELAVNLKPGVSMGERIFSWFVGGLMAGALLFALLVEGEFFFSLRRAARLFEKEAEIISRRRRK
ncbi:MAG: hypothetical protein ACP5O3_01710 [Candidatus Micrarchaeia archaeon]